MDKKTRELFEVSLSETQSRVLAATTSGIAIELVEHLGEKDYGKVVKISESLVDNFGEKVRFNRNSVRKYFNYPQTLPFVGKLRDQIIGFLVGVPLENFGEEPWAKSDPTLGQHLTVYTYAFIFFRKYHKTGYAKMLKRVYLNWLRKRGFGYVSGHVREGVAQKFSPNTVVLQKFPDWHETGKVFEYYHRPLA